MALDLQLFGRRLREARRVLGLTQAQFAIRLGAANGWISELENGRQTHIQADTVYRCCEALGVSADFLLGLSDLSTSVSDKPMHCCSDIGKNDEEVFPISHR